ncbi:MAG TPA: TIGR03118 family protein [Terriglobales bacterium]|nr:TIGR03118 family protein [Terriglobales bacterium]
MRNTAVVCVAITILCALAVSHAAAQSNAYQQTNLVSDIAGMASHTDPKLINPWGISFFPGQPFWVADNNSGFSTLYDATGASQQPTVLIPPPNGSTASSTPTGTVANSTGGFVVGSGPSLFLFDTEDGTISGWNGVGTTAILAVDHSSAGAVYKGLAMVNVNSADFLLATNFNSGKVEIYDKNFQTATLTGSFTDPNLPAGFAPFGIQTIGNQVFVTYAMQDSAKHDPVDGPGNGFVSIFNFDGTFVKRFASNGTLNSPWGVVMTPSSFGAFSNNVLVGNFGDGTINAFDPATGNFLGQMNGTNGTPLTNSGLWALVFGAGGTGNFDTLYFTAGLAGETHGLFGSIDVSTGGGGNTPDFSITPSAQSLSVPVGGSANLMLSVSPVNGFTGTVTFSCQGPAGVSCTFNPPTVTPSGTAAMTTMTVSAASGGHYGPRAMWLGLSGLGLFGVLGTGLRRKRLATVILSFIGVAVLSSTLLSSVGCGGGSSNSAQPGTVSLAVTATSGAVMHTTMVTLNVH